jgi:hypothetical protein
MQFQVTAPSPKVRPVKALPVFGPEHKINAVHEFTSVKIVSNKLTKIQGY